MSQSDMVVSPGEYFVLQHKVWRSRLHLGSIVAEASDSRVKDHLFVFVSQCPSCFLMREIVFIIFFSWVRLHSKISQIVIIIEPKDSNRSQNFKNSTIFRNTKIMTYLTKPTWENYEYLLLTLQKGFCCIIIKVT